MKKISLFLIMLFITGSVSAQGLSGFGSTVDSRCAIIENLAAADDNKSLGSFNRKVTVTEVWCQYSGSGSTVAQISLEDGSGNAMTHTVPTCTAIGTAPSRQKVTAGNILNARESLAFDVDNAVDPETDTYSICFSVQ